MPQYIAKHQDAAPTEADAGSPDVRETVRYAPLMVALVATSAGILADGLFDLPWQGWFVATLASLIGWRYRRRLAVAASHMDLSHAFLCAALISIGGLWHHAYWNAVAKNHIGQYAVVGGESVFVEGIVVEMPWTLPARESDVLSIIPSNDRTCFTIRATRIRMEDSWRPVSGCVPVSVTGHVLGVHPGDTVRVAGSLERPTPPMNPGAFDRAAYARSDRVGAELFAATPDAVTVHRHGSRWDPRRWPTALRTAGIAILQRHLSEENAPLATAMLLGYRGEVSREQMTTFRETGTAHLLAISGLHVGLVAGGVFFLLRALRFPAPTVAVSVAVIVIAYACLTGGRPPVIRATLFIVIFCIGVRLGRKTISFNALAAAGLLILAWNPSDLFRLGPQLSFLAAGTIAYLGPAWREKHRDTDDSDSSSKESRPPLVRWAVRFIFRPTWELIRLSTAVWLVSLPLVMHHFHLFTPLGILLTPLTWLPVSAGLLTGFAVLLTGWLCPPIAGLAAIGCDQAFSLLRELTALFQSTPFGHIYVSGPPSWWIVGYYAVLAVWALSRKNMPAWGRRCPAALTLWVTIGLVASFAGDHMQRDTLRVTVLAMDHGESIIIELPDGRTMLYDAGRSGSSDTASRIVSEALWAQGISKIDAIFVSHADSDHFNGVPKLLDRFPVGRVFVPPSVADSDAPSARLLREAIEKHEIPLKRLSRGDTTICESSSYETNSTVGMGDKACRISVMHPPKDVRYQEDNASSLVLSLEYRGETILLTGDIESPGAEQLLAQPAPTVGVLIAPHHGSPSSDPESICRWCWPGVVIVSGGKQDIWGTTMATYEQFAGEVYHTGIDGSLRIVVDRDGLKVAPSPRGRN